MNFLLPNYFAILPNFFSSLFWIFLDDDNDDISLATQEDFSFCLENQVKRIYVKTFDCKEPKRKRLVPIVPDSDSSKRICYDTTTVNSSDSSDSEPEDLVSSQCGPLSSVHVSDTDDSSSSSNTTLVELDRNPIQIDSEVPTNLTEQAEVITIADDEGDNNINIEDSAENTTVMETPTSPINSEPIPLPWRNEPAIPRIINRRRRNNVTSDIYDHITSSSDSSRRRSQPYAGTFFQANANAQAGTCLFTGPNGSGSVNYSGVIPSPGTYNNSYVPYPAPRMFSTFSHVVGEMNNNMRHMRESINRNIVNARNARSVAMQNLLSNRRRSSVVFDFNSNRI